MRALIVGVGLLGACGDATNTDPIQFGTLGPLVGDAGRGSWRFGVATAATQIEDMNIHTDWWMFTAPTAQGGLGRHTFVGDATRGYTKMLEDVALVKGMGLDSYRFSMEWARIEPMKDVIEEAAIAHYRSQLEALNAMGNDGRVERRQFHDRGPQPVVGGRSRDRRSGRGCGWADRVERRSRGHDEGQQGRPDGRFGRHQPGSHRSRDGVGPLAATKAADMAGFLSARGLQQGRRSQRSSTRQFSNPPSPA